MFKWNRSATVAPNIKKVVGLLHEYCYILIYYIGTNFNLIH